MEYLNQGHDKSLTELARTGHRYKIEEKVWLQIRTLQTLFELFFAARVKYIVLMFTHQ